MGLPCMVGKCDADNARARLASGVELHPVERADLELAAKGCTGPQVDPFGERDPSDDKKPLMWPECPAKAAHKRHDIADALTLKGLQAMAPLAGWPIGYTARSVETWIAIEGERAAIRAERSEQ